MRDEVESDGFVWRKWVTFIILIGLLWSIWFLFFSYNNCSDKACFDSSLKSCSKAKFISGGDMIFRYVIKGEKGNNCEVSVKLLQGRLNNADSVKLEGQAMTCILPLGVVTVPESDISVCHGLLKEGLQDLVISKLHSYLVQNLGRLNLEMVGLPKGA